jgi:lipopolysaccharide transport system ATP-binding protein
MSEFAIQIEDLGKRFTIGSNDASRGLHQLYDETIRRMIRPFSGSAKNTKADNGERILWALRNININIRHGEIVGLIGHNGAGKSVLLKTLSRITWPTEGHAILQGKVGSMLEVGAGFHPEFTGRENLYLIGAILGMEISEIRAKFDTVVNFAGVEEMLDTPVKRYSSGMYVRLAFAVAAHLDANIMLFDEVISVGDVDFREKCQQRIREMADEGRTIIFVSHNMETIKDICPRTIVLNHGHIIHDGSTQSALALPRHHIEPSAPDQELFET